MPSLSALRTMARRLPAPVKAILRSVLPERVIRWAPSIRRFSVAMPIPPSGLGSRTRPAPRPARVAIEADGRSLVPRLLQEQGIARYEPETMAAVLSAITFLDAPEVFDVGANVGAFAIVIAATTTTAVTAFEPTPTLAATLTRIATLNGLACTIEPIALGAATGPATLFLSARSDSSNSLRAGFRQALDTVDVQVERLDDYVARTGRVPAVLKIDTETTEPDVLAGGAETIRRARPWIVCEVLAGRTEAALTDALRSHGYRFHHLDGGVPRETDRIVGDLTYAHRDWLFTPEPLPAGFDRHYEAWLAALAATR